MENMMLKKVILYALLIISFSGFTHWGGPTQEQIDKSYDELCKLKNKELVSILKELTGNENYVYTNAIQILCERDYDNFIDLIEYHINNYENSNRALKRFAAGLINNLIEYPIYHKYKNDQIAYHKELIVQTNKYSPIFKEKGIYISIIGRTGIENFSDEELLEIGYSKEWIDRYRQNQKNARIEQARIDSIISLPDSSFIDNWFKYHYNKRKDIESKNSRNAGWASPMNSLEFHNRGLDYYPTVEKYYDIIKEKNEDKGLVNFIRDCIDYSTYVKARADSMTQKNRKDMKEYLKSVSRPYNPNPVLTNEKGPRFVRAEDAGVSFKDTTKAVLLERLQNSTNRIELQKVSRVLGDRFIANILALTEAENKIIYDAVVKFINYQDSDDCGTREEGRFNIHRLWRLAVPALIDNLHNDNIRKKELAAKCLLFMKNEEIVQKIIELAEKEKNPEMKKKLIFVLNKVEKVVKTTVPDRKSIDEDESKALFDRLVKPALNKLEKK